MLEDLQVEVVSSHPRFESPGWKLQGTLENSCEACDGRQTFRIYRKPYVTRSGAFRYWAIVCLGCRSVTSLGDHSSERREVFRRWDELSTANEMGSRRPHRLGPSQEEASQSTRLEESPIRKPSSDGEHIEPSEPSSDEFEAMMSVATELVSADTQRAVALLEILGEASWAEAVGSETLGVSAEFHFENLRDECISARAHLLARPTDAQLRHARLLGRVFEGVAAFGLLDLTDAALALVDSLIRVDSLEDEDAKAALRAYLDASGRAVGSTFRAAGAGGIKRRELLSVMRSLRATSEGRVWMPQLERQLQGVGEESPIGTLLGISAVAALFGTQAQQEKVDGLIPRPDEAGEAFAQTVDVATELRRLSRPLGFVRLSDVIDELRAVGSTASLPEVGEELKSIESIGGLGEGWSWIKPGGAGTSLPLLIAEKLAFVAGRPFTGADLKRAMARYAAGLNSTVLLPAPSVLSEWAGKLDHFRVDSDGLIEASKAISDDVLSSDELAIVDVVSLEPGSVCRTETLLQELSASDEVGVATREKLSRSVVLVEVGSDVWGLAGAEFDPQAAERLAT